MAVSDLLLGVMAQPIVVTTEDLTFDKYADGELGVRQQRQQKAASIPQSSMASEIRYTVTNLSGGKIRQVGRTLVERKTKHFEEFFFACHHASHL